jgi:hypothetical protein
VCLGLKTARRKRSQLCLYSPQKFNSAFGKFTYFFLSDLKFSCVYSAVFAIFLDVIRYSYLSIRPALSLWLLDRLAWNERSTSKTSVFERKPYLNANNVRTQDILFVNLSLQRRRRYQLISTMKFGFLSRQYTENSLATLYKMNLFILFDSL